MKGIFYSLMMAMFITSILALIVFYSQAKPSNIDVSIRSSEMDYFTKSIENDLARFMEINGRRALISAVSQTIVNGTGLDNSQLRLIEMIENGTLYGKPAPLIDINNLEHWKLNISNIASNLGFHVDFKNLEINITQNDSFNILFNVTLYVNISNDNTRMGILKNITSNVIVSVEDIEDPIFPLNTYGRIIKFIRKSNVSKSTAPLVMGQNSSGYVVGYAFVKTDFQPSDVNSSRILVTNTVAGKEAIASGFEGVVSEGDLIIPPVLLGKAITEATSATSLIKNETKIYLDATTKKVWDLSNLTSDIINGYYHSSNKGASFLDRLEGRTNLSDKYIYGLETFVNIQDMLEAEVPTNTGSSVLDYRYWNNTNGVSIRNGNYDSVYNWFKIDTESANEYGIAELMQ